MQLCSRSFSGHAESRVSTRSDGERHVTPTQRASLEIHSGSITAYAEVKDNCGSLRSGRDDTALVILGESSAKSAWVKSALFGTFFNVGRIGNDYIMIA